MCYFCLSYFIISTISKVLLVGGSSKIPLVSELLVNQLGFPVHKLNRSVNADELLQGVPQYLLPSSAIVVRYSWIYISVLFYFSGEGNLIFS